MSLTLSLSPANNDSTQNDPFLQQWGPQPATTTYQYNTYLFIAPTPVAVNFLIRDVFGLLEFQNYSEFRLLAQQTFSPSNVPAWIAPASYTGDGYPNSLAAPLAYENGLTFSFTPTFQNLALLSVGTYIFNHEFYIQGLDQNGFWVNIDTHIHQTILNVVDSLVEYDPQWLNFFHLQGGTLPYKDIAVDGVNWEFRGYPNFILSSSTGGVTVTSEVIGGQTYYKASGTGPATIRCTLETFFDTESSYTFEELISGIDAYSNDIFVGAILISVDVVPIPTLSVSETSLAFTGIKGIVEPTPIDLIVLASEPPYTVTKSPWLTVVETTAEVNGIIRPVTRVVPMPTANMEVGSFEGFVKFTDTVDGDLVEINIPVTYELQGFVQSPYPQFEKAFTLDPRYFQFLSQYPDTYFQVDATIKTYDFFTGIEKERVINEKVPIFQGEGSLNFGETIHRLMNKFTAPNENSLQYKPAKLSINVKEISLIDETVLRESFVQNIEFLAGISNGLIGDIRFLEFNKRPDRVTKSSFYYLNILVPQGSFELRVFKNTNQIDTIPLSHNFGNVIFKKINFSEFSIGDVISYTINRVGDLETDVPTKTFYVIPEGKYSNHIVWQSEFLLQSCFEFTGGGKIQADFENRTQNVYQNLVEVMEIITNTKINKLTISTGWIIKDSIDTIESLLRSKKAWLLLPDKRVSLRPISKTIIAEDTDRELVEYSIEFQINRAYNEETYFF